MREENIRKFNQALHDSIVKALAEKDDSSAPLYAYIKEHAQELDDTVIQQHIDLYVNKYSLSLKGKGKLAVEKLFALLKEHDPLMSRLPTNLQLEVLWEQHKGHVFPQLQKKPFRLFFSLFFVDVAR